MIQEHIRLSIIAVDVIEEKRPLPVDVRDGAILHAGPIIRPLGEDKYEMVTVGPKTSMRMEKFEEEFIKVNKRKEEVYEEICREVKFIK